ncbi:EAL domain-containing protein [Robertmurraya massiliosenegalensis]|uniref:EAL domain-containing protein n=1 Tax=Robertmurraya TaxID=2837507 RepID=UPI0039A4D17C
MKNTSDFLLQNLKINHYIQPITNLTNNHVIGYEFLLRSETIKNPELLFQTASHANQLLELDMKSVFKAIETINSHYTYFKTKLLFINVFPATLMESSFLQGLLNILSKTTIKTNSIVLEINESANGKNISALKEAICLYKKHGFIIALDDVGKGDSTVMALLEIEPDIVKIDKYFSIDLAKSIKKQKIIKLLVQFIDQDATVVLEGIETNDDLKMAKSIGVPFAQGYYLGKPQPLASYF